MLEALKQDLAKAIECLKQENIRLLGKGSMTLFDRSNNLILTEPATSDSNCDADSILITDTNGSIVEGTGNLIPSLPAHLELYRSFSTIGAIVHSHGLYTTAWAQSGRDIPVYGTNHLEFFKEAIPCTHAVTLENAEESYGSAAGRCMVEIFQKKALNPESVPAVLLFQHGAYVWGHNVDEAIHHAVALEKIAHLAFLTEKINADITDRAGNITPRY
ncbi:MAG: class II aldolase/adducin family protein [Clostridia bacterium]|nr:class II aldolase/adducin family protein [Clostridia bacterium]